MAASKKTKASENTSKPAARKTADKKVAPQQDTTPDLTNDPSAVKDPSTWVTGGEPMTGAQASYVHTLARQAGEEAELPAEMTKAEASEKIEELREKTGK